MKIVERSEIEQLIRATPNLPQNQTLLHYLNQLSNALTVVKEPYMYPMASGVLAAGAVSPPTNVNIDASAAFVICNQTFEADLAGVAQLSGTLIFPNVSIMLVDTGSGKQLMQAPIPITSIFGNGQFPYILPEPMILAPNSVLQGTLTSFEVAATPTIRLSFNGYKIKALG